MTTTGRGLGWPLQERASDGHRTGILPDSGLGWPKPSWMPGTRAATAAEGAGSARSSGASSEQGFRVALAGAGGMSSEGAGPVAWAGAVTVSAMVTRRSGPGAAERVLAGTGSPPSARAVARVSPTGHAAATTARARGEWRDWWGSGQLWHRGEAWAESERWVEGWQRAEEWPGTGIDGVSVAAEWPGGEKEASAVRGNGDVRRGLGWPESRSAASALERRHASRAGAAGVQRPPTVVPVVEHEEGVEREGGLGWPDEGEPPHGRHALLDRGERRGSAPDSAVSRETPALGRWRDDGGSGHPMRSPSEGAVSADASAVGEHRTADPNAEASERRAAERREEK